MKDDLEDKNKDPEPIVASDVDLDDSVVAEEGVAEQIKKLREKLRLCESEKQQYLSGWQRAKADLINARRQDEKEKTEFAKYANESLLEELLPILEHFEMAMAHKEKWESVDKSWRTGIEQIFSQFRKVLEKNNVKELDPKGLDYDPSTHDAIGLVETANKNMDNKIVDVVSKGFSLNGKIVKAPKVRVAHYKETKG